MNEFFQVLSPAEALARVEERLRPLGAVEEVPLSQAAGRVLAKNVVAVHPLPPFPRSTMDGYAVRACDTHGAGEGGAAELQVAGEVAMGRAAGLRVEPGRAAVIHTGGMLPPGADAVVPVEYTQALQPGVIEVYRAVGPGENVIQPGEDFREGEAVLAAGAWLGAAEVGVLAALGVTPVAVARQPRVALLSQGDELVPPDREPAPGQVRDINAYSLAVQVERAGGRVIPDTPILPDQLEALEGAAREALGRCDLLVFTAGSSVSRRDLTARVAARLGEPGILAHGLAIRPGKPTVLAVCGGKPVMGLPGNPVSALVVFGQVVEPLIARLMGARPRPRPVVFAELARNLPSVAGREDRVPVRLRAEGGRTVAEPLLGRSNAIGLLVKAHGLAVIARDLTGFHAGARVPVELWFR